MLDPEPEVVVDASVIAAAKAEPQPVEQPLPASLEQQEAMGLELVESAKKGKRSKR